MNTTSWGLLAPYADRRTDFFEGLPVSRRLRGDTAVRPQRAARSPEAASIAAQAARGHKAVFCVLDVTVDCAKAHEVRERVAQCPEAGVVRSEPLLHASSAQETAAPQVRLMIRLPLGRYAQVLHLLLETLATGEIGRLVPWREHLARCGLRHG